ncbi:hypothetical protein LDO32_01290 [Luteimonas sp. Y-2-2-4F]|nr:hypothetical protein [Luteimonas sp. Y-2-2-4F]MCD9030369.1 hypothetical protein [Luteimonas sp. Y-2-2-4F]
MEMQQQVGRFNTVRKVGAGVGLALLSGVVMAQDGPDTSGATAAFAAAATAIAAVGAAMVTAAGAGIVYRWVTAFLVK